MSINDRILNLTEQFANITDWEDRYKHIISMGKEVPTLPEEFRTDVFKIKGCQSQVWLHPTFKDSILTFTGDSDAAIVKGIVAMLIFVYSGSSPTEIMSTEPKFLEDIGIKEHLSMSRSNGLSSMLKQIKLYAVAFSAMNKQ